MSSMTSRVPFYFVDVFATRPLTGNPLSLVPDQSTVIVEQGYAVGRPSAIAVSVSGPRVRVGGSGLVVAEGTLAV